LTTALFFVKTSHVRKIFILLIVLFTSLVFCVSCKTSEVAYTDEDVYYVMNLVLDTSLNKAMTKCSSYLNSKEDFIPFSYQILADYRDKIAGLDTLLLEWTKYAKSTCVDGFELFRNHIQNLRDDFIIDDPVSAAKEGPASISSQFKSQYYSEISQKLYDLTQTFDTTILDKAIHHYNSWVLANRNLKNSEILTTIKETDISKELSIKLTDIFFDQLFSSEELFRTTPSADMESKVEAILGLN